MHHQSSSHPAFTYSCAYVCLNLSRERADAAILSLLARVRVRRPLRTVVARVLVQRQRLAGGP